MIRIFYLKNNEIQWEKNPSELIPKDAKLLWVDLQSPGKEEKKWVEDTFSIELFTAQEAAEIESSSRYMEDLVSIEANSSFIVYERQAYRAEQVSFIYKDKLLFTLRNADLKAFAETVRKLKSILNPEEISGPQLWLSLLESRIDLDADFIESLNRHTNIVSKKIVKEKSYEEDVLIRITELQENCILIRESIVDKQRLVSSLLKSSLITDLEKDRLRIVFKDIASLLQHTEFVFERLEFLQNTFVGLVGIEQNQVIKIFTVVTVVFMPPTLIASIYGMNFQYMPELGWTFGYPFAVLLMIVSSMGFLWYFKHKKWL